MADIEPRRARQPARRQREQRAYALTLATGAAAVVSVVFFVLAIFGVMGFGLPILAAILAAALGFLLKRTLGI